jgi:hypothetical protein
MSEEGSYSLTGEGDSADPDPEYGEIGAVEKIPDYKAVHNRGVDAPDGEGEGELYRWPDDMKWPDLPIGQRLGPMTRREDDIQASGLETYSKLRRKQERAEAKVRPSGIDGQSGIIKYYKGMGDLDQPTWDWMNSKPEYVHAHRAIMEDLEARRRFGDIAYELSQSSMGITTVDSNRTFGGYHMFHLLSNHSDGNNVYL